MPEITSPTYAPGFATAVALGMTPQVPDERPSLIPGPTAAAAHQRWIMRSGISSLVWVVAVVAATSLPDPVGLVAGLVALAVGLVGFFRIVLRHLPEQVGSVALEELAAGYTTLPLTWGGFWRTPGHRLGIRYREPWNYSGLWILTPNGEVRSRPGPGILPPGLYPSIARPGTLELWTGAAWGQVWVSPERPFLPW